MLRRSGGCNPSPCGAREIAVILESGDARGHRLARVSLIISLATPPAGVKVAPVQILGQSVRDETESGGDRSTACLSCLTRTRRQRYEPSRLGVPATHRAGRGCHRWAVDVTITEFLDDLARVVACGEPTFCLASELRPRVRAGFRARSPCATDLPHMSLKSGRSPNSQRPGRDPHLSEAIGKDSAVVLVQVPVLGVSLAQPYRHPVREMNKLPRLLAGSRTDGAGRTATRWVVDRQRLWGARLRPRPLARTPITTLRHRRIVPQQPVTAHHPRVPIL